MLFEAGTEGFFDTIITVVADPAISRQKRFQNDTEKGAEEYEQRMPSQWPLEDKGKKS